MADIMPVLNFISLITIMLRDFSFINARIFTPIARIHIVTSSCTATTTFFIICAVLGVLCRRSCNTIKKYFTIISPNDNSTHVHIQICARLSRRRPYDSQSFQTIVLLKVKDPLLPLTYHTTLSITSVAHGILHVWIMWHAICTVATSDINTKQNPSRTPISRSSLSDNGIRVFNYAPRPAFSVTQCMVCHFHSKDNKLPKTTMEGLYILFSTCVCPNYNSRYAVPRPSSLFGSRCGVVFQCTLPLHIRSFAPSKSSHNIRRIR